jgi:hypothetical protein
MHEQSKRAWASQNALGRKADISDLKPSHQTPLHLKELMPGFGALQDKRDDPCMFVHPSTCLLKFGISAIPVSGSLPITLSNGIWDPEARQMGSGITDRFS